MSKPVDDIAILAHGFYVLKVLVLDAKISAAQNTRVLLSSNGITEVEIVREPQEAVSALTSGKYDIFIVEWDMKPESGIDLVKRIRHEKPPVNISVPVLMLTNRSDSASAKEAINAGVNEIYVRPASPQGIARSICSIINYPRGFIVAPNYRGPDRRPAAMMVTAGKEDRISNIPDLITKAELVGYDPNIGGPRMVLPDFSLKAKVNRAATASGKVSLEEVENEFIRSGLSDVDIIKSMFKEIEKAIGSRAPIERMCSASQMVQARSDAYDYDVAAKVAQFLSDFCKSYFNVHNPTHRLVIEKHIQSLQVVLNMKMRGSGGKTGEELVNELSKLMLKFV